jgi:glycosyltransferase involved in cell wall biosynthesis
MKVLVIINYVKITIEMTLKPLLQCDKVDRLYVIHDREVPELGRVEYSSLPKRLYGFLPSIPQGIARNLMMLIAAFRLVISKKPDVIMSFNISHSPAAFLCAKLFRKPVIVNIDDAPRMWRLWRRLVPMLKHCDAVTVTGTRNKADLVRMGLSSDKVYILFDSVDIEKFKPISLPKVYDIITVARLVSGKGTDTLLRVIAEIIRKYKQDVKLGIVGDGPLKAFLQKLAAELDIVGNVDFVNWKENTEFYYNSARIFCLPSHHEGLPMTMLEAMACGVPPVVSNVGDVTDAVEDGVNGIVIDNPLDINGFTNAIISLLREEGLYQKVSQNARMVRDKYCYESATKCWNEILNSITITQK